ncbi:MAG: hypothetical protein KDD44_05875 [Bdellovibrionales bacterium]|nr:hypothetical protein [Bdellovibrionales bacterium]
MAEWDNQETADLMRAVLSLKNASEAKRFFRDLLTEGELLEMGRRWKAARMLHDGASYATVEAETGLSSATVARISKWLKEGTGGYRVVLKRLS